MRNKQKAEEKRKAKAKQQGIVFTMPRQQVGLGERGLRKKKPGRINCSTTQQTRARKLHLP